MSIAISTHQLEKYYRSYEKTEGLWASIQSLGNRKYFDKYALFPTDLTLEEGQIVGLVGANGAGKTTLIKLLSGLVYPSGGSAKVLGFTPSDRDSDFLRQIGLLLGQKNQLWWDISPMDSFSMLANIYDLDPAQARDRVHDLAKIMNAEHVLNTQLRRLSLGERMKMEIIGALLHQPKVLFLDEPTIGLDIVAQSNIREFLMAYVKEFRPTILLTSHYMDDIALLAQQLLLMQKGCIVYQGTVTEFVQQAQNSQTEEVDFEQVIHSFLQAEHHVR